MRPQPYGPFPYVASVDRPKLEWPGGAHVALWIVTNIEFFPLDGPVDEGKHIPSVRAWSQRDYGNRVGIFRLMSLLQKFNIKSTVALNSDICRIHPNIVRACVDLGWDFMGHCRNNRQRLDQVPLEEERALIADVLNTIEKATGTRPAGWLGAALAETWQTLEHLADENCTYVADWVNDDQPYWMNVEDKRILSLPYTYELNDIPAIARGAATSADFERAICDTFDVLYEEGAVSGKVMCIALHPYIIGQPNLIQSLGRSLAYINGHPAVWKATGSEIAEYFKSLNRDY